MHLGTIKRTWPAASCRSPRRRRTPTAQPATGALTFVDNAVDMTTDTIKLKATFDNADRRLWPGQFARVIAAAHDARRTRPSCRRRRCRPARTASSSSSSRPTQTVEQRPVTVGQRVERRRRHREGPEAGRDGRHRRPAAARAGHARARPDRRPRRPARRRRRRTRRARRRAAAQRRDRRGGGSGAQRAVAGRSSEAERVNISEIFIRRPIATSLLMVGDRAVRRRRVSRAAGQRSAAGRLPDAQRQRRPARRRSRHDGVGGGEPARAAVHDDRRPRLDDLVAAAPGSTNITLQFDLDRDIDSADGRRADGDRRGDAAAAGGHAVAAVVPQEQPGRPADPDAQPDVATRCRCRRSTTTRRR